MTVMLPTLRGLHIGLDLDNTLVIYDHVFGDAAVELGLLPIDHALSTKAAIKAHMLSNGGGEANWMRLQGQVYGRLIGRATLCEGAEEFLLWARSAGARVSIVSHKTHFGHVDADRINLWDAAYGWLERWSFFDQNSFNLARADVHFCETRADKIARISAIGCHVFVDDLLEVFQEKQFPASVHRIWYNRDPGEWALSGLVPHRNWLDVKASINSREVLHKLDLTN
jgi:hypothetical protein